MTGNASDLAARLEAGRAGGRKLLVPFLTAGHPDLATSAAAMAAMARAGVDAIELGVPFSDPLADGPVVAAAAERALANGTTLERVLALAAERPAGDAPLVLFTYLNPLHARGYARTAADLARAGFAGALVADLPFDEGAEVRSALAAEGLPLIALAAPTTPRERLRALGRAARGFVYLVARTGVTGAGAGADRRLVDQVRILREETALPIVVGFGIADADAARQAADAADGIVVGSAFVERLERSGVASAVEWIASLREALDAG
ncbi:MAG TPA: tryptophan synthase subunit alpha [Gemmatimonadota bacterium]|nr:tryptophan synthase subunit alpha [Gemmatimonadota bacterium]